MFKIKFPTKRIFRIFPILKMNGMAPFCNLFMERPTEFASERILTAVDIWQICGQWHSGMFWGGHSAVRPHTAVT